MRPKASNVIQIAPANMNGNVVRTEGLIREIWHFNLSNDLTIRFHKYELLKFHAGNCPDHERLELWKYPDLHNASNIGQPEVPAWAMNDAKTLILTKIKMENC